MSTEICNLYKCVHAVALTKLVVTLPNGREYQVPQGHVFLASPDPAHTAALAKLCRRADADIDSNAAVASDKQLFRQYRDRFFDLAFHDAQLQLAVKIQKFIAPPPAIVIDCADRGFGTAPPAPRVVTGFEQPR